VTYRSIIGRFSSWSQVIVIGFRTIPKIRNCQVAGSTSGGYSEVSIR
jgi:hypothetical protein